MLNELKNFNPFRSLDRAALAAVAEHTDRLRLPGERWLRRRGQPLSRELFLVDGVVSVRGEKGAQRITARSAQGDSLNACAETGAEISTVTAVEVLAVDLAPIRHLLDGGGTSAMPTVAEIDGWMHALLQGPVMRWFPPNVWVRVLRAGKFRVARQGELIVAEGEVADRVFVVAAGAAAYAGERFGPGGFFAEESALLQRPAGSDAIMETDGALVSFARADVLELLAEYDAPPVVEPQRLDLDALSDASEDELLAGLEPATPIAVRGADAARRLVVAAKLMRRGFTVV